MNRSQAFYQTLEGWRLYSVPRKIGLKEKFPDELSKNVLPTPD